MIICVLKSKIHVKYPEMYGQFYLEVWVNTKLLFV